MIRVRLPPLGNSLPKITLGGLGLRPLTSFSVMNPLTFLSYSSKDKLIADAICSRLENQGIRCWIAPRDVKPGTDYSNQIADALESATTMVMVFSSESNNSRHVKSEIDRAFSLGKIIIPFRVENVELDKGLAYYLAKTHWLDAVTRPLEQHIDKLAATIRQISGAEAPEISQRPPPPPPSPVVAPVVTPAPSRLPWVIAGALVFCGIVGGLVLLIVLLNQRKSERAEASHSVTASTPAVAVPPSASTPLAATTKLVDPARAPVSDQDLFEGTWKITEAETLTGNPYSGTAEVHKSGSRYEVAWRSTASDASGIGLPDGNKLCVAWGSSEFGVVFYKIGADGTLRGRWTTTTAPADAVPGLENASGGSPTSVAGEYIIKGNNPGGTAPYEGKLQIAKTGRTYQLKWTVGDAVTNGVGIKVDDALFVAWAVDGKPFGVVAFTFEPGQAKGVWTLAGATQTAPENWKR